MASVVEGLDSSMARDRKSYFVYIMGSLSGTLYIGMTSKLNARVFEHKFHRVEGFTDRYNVERLLYCESFDDVSKYCESFDDVSKAINRERQLKGWRRSKKIGLIESSNPHWLDLSRDWYQWMTNSSASSGASTPPDDSLRSSSAPLSMTMVEGSMKK